ncbi:MAG: DMT family transporter [Rhodospirillales bacterium]
MDAAPENNPPADAPENKEQAALYRRGLMLCVIAGVFWSLMGLGIRFAESAGVWQILFYRSVGLVPFLFVVMALRSRGLPFAVIRRAGLAGVLGALGLLMAFSTSIYAVQTTTVANAMFLFAAAPFITAVLGRVILRESVRPATWAAMTAAMCGIVIMVADNISPGRLMGNAAGLASALGFAVFTVALRMGRVTDMLPAVFLAGVFALVFAGVMILAQGESFALPTPDLLAVLGLGVVQLGFGLTLYTMGSKHVPAVDLALLSLAEVILGPMWVWLFLGETAALMTIAGGAVLLAAVAGNALAGIRRKPVPTLN